MMGQSYDMIENKSDLYYKHQWRDVSVHMFDPGLLSYIALESVKGDPVAIDLSHRIALDDGLSAIFNISLQLEV